MAEPSTAPPLPPPTVASSAYDEAYYTTCCAGAHEWSHSGGRDVAGIYKWALTTAGFAAGETLLDIGTGRGELVALAAERGARWALGIEYSADAMAMCRKTFEAHEATRSAYAVLADARQLPIPDGSVDVVMMLDVVEHLTADELDRCLAEVRRCLSPRGRLFVHTFPTSTVYNVTYRAQRNLLPWRRRTWPANPRTAAEQSMHVNEQTPARLARSLRAVGLQPSTVRLGEWVYCDFVPSDSARKTYARLARHRLTARFGIANLWALAEPEAVLTEPEAVLTGPEDVLTGPAAAERA